MNIYFTRHIKHQEYIIIFIRLEKEAPPPSLATHRQAVKHAETCPPIPDVNR